MSCPARGEASPGGLLLVALFVAVAMGPFLQELRGPVGNSRSLLGALPHSPGRSHGVLRFLMGAVLPPHCDATEINLLPFTR